MEITVNLYWMQVLTVNNIYCESKINQQYFSFIYVDRFSKFFHLWIQQEIYNKTRELCSQIILRNLKCH